MRHERLILSLGSLFAAQAPLDAIDTGLAFLLSAGDLIDGGHRYASPGKSDCFVLHKIGRAGTVCRRRGVVRVGSEYCLAHDVLHRVLPDGRGPTATLFLQGPVRRQFTTVLTGGQRIVEPAASIALQRASEDECRARLLEVRALLLARGGLSDRSSVA